MDGCYVCEQCGERLCDAVTLECALCTAEETVAAAEQALRGAGLALGEDGWFSPAGRLPAGADRWGSTPEAIIALLAHATGAAENFEDDVLILNSAIDAATPHLEVAHSSRPVAVAMRLLERGQLAQRSRQRDRGGSPREDVDTLLAAIDETVRRHGHNDTVDQLVVTAAEVRERMVTRG